MTEWFYILAIGLNLMPFLYLRYYPFREHLRTSVKWLVLCHGFALLVEIGAYMSIYHTEGKLFYEQGFILHNGFILVYFIYSLCMIRENIYRQLYLLFPLALYAMAVSGVGVWMERRAGGLVDLPRFLVLDVTMITLLAITMPFVLRFLQFVETLFDRKSTDEWKLGWIPAACFFLLEMIHTMVSSQSLGVMALGRLASFTAVALYLVFQIWFLYIQQQRVIFQQNLRISQELAKRKMDKTEWSIRHEAQAKARKIQLDEFLKRLQGAADKRDAVRIAQIVAEKESEWEGMVKCRRFSNQELLDAVLCMADEKARKNGIRTEIRVNLKKPLRMNDTDLCVLFGSLLDNAMEACMILPENQRWMTLRVESAGSMTAISVDNSCNTDIIKSEGDVFYSAKRGYDAPGIGMISICDIAKKYDGTYLFSHKEGIFKAQIFCRGGSAS